MATFYRSWTRGQTDEVKKKKNHFLPLLLLALQRHKTQNLSWSSKPSRGQITNKKPEGSEEGGNIVDCGPAHCESSLALLGSRSTLTCGRGAWMAWVCVLCSDHFCWTLAGCLYVFTGAWEPFLTLRIDLVEASSGARRVCAARLPCIRLVPFYNVNSYDLMMYIDPVFFLLYAWQWKLVIYGKKILINKLNLFVFTNSIYLFRSLKTCISPYSKWHINIHI